MSLSNITLTAAVRQNLLSLQGTADLLATTQGRLATGKKVNSALDNPTNFFTAAGLDARASDISNLLDSIGNGVQVLQAANTGITSLSKLVDTAKSIANQVLQQPSGYSAKATYTGNAPTGAGPLAVAGTATDLTNNGTNSLEGQDNSLQYGSWRDHDDYQQNGWRRQNQLDHWSQHGTRGGGHSVDRKPQRQRLADLHLGQRCRLPDHHQRCRLCCAAGRCVDLGEYQYLQRCSIHGRSDCRRGRRPGIAGHARVVGQLSTTRSLRRSPPRRRTRPSTASTC